MANRVLLIKYEKVNLEDHYENAEGRFYCRLYNKLDNEFGVVDDNEFVKMQEIVKDKQMALLSVRSDNETLKRFSNFVIENFDNTIVLEEKAPSAKKEEK